MSTISINLPDSVVSAVTERAQKNGFVDVGAYVSQMISRISQRQSEVQDLAIAGIESGPSEPWSSTEIESIRKGIQAKFGT
jgi:Arc/MetJ-type ribon-helix-helix transcriptional regulator